MAALESCFGPACDWSGPTQVLAFSGGIYVYIAATEAAACFTHKRLSPKMKFGVVFLFILGAVAIGLVLLDHEHCEGDPEAGSGGHAGHNH